MLHRLLHGACRGGAGPLGAGGTPDRPHLGRGPGPRSDAGAAGSRRRAVHGRGRPGARLSGSSGPDGGALPAGPGGEGGGRAPVQDRRPGALAPVGGPRVPRPDRRAGQGAGLPGRAGRDRDGPDGPPAAERRGGAGAAGGGRGAPAGGVRGGRGGRDRRAGAVRAARFSAPAAARVHGAVRLGLPAGPAPDRQRQGRPQGARPPAAGPAAEHRRSPAHAGRAADRGHLRPSCWASGRWGWRRTSSTWEGIRCWRPGWCRGCARCSEWSCRCRRSSRRRPSRAWPPGSGTPRRRPWIPSCAS